MQVIANDAIATDALDGLVRRVARAEQGLPDTWGEFHELLRQYHANGGPVSQRRRDEHAKRVFAQDYAQMVRERKAA